MIPATIRLWFCATVAIVAAAVADPLIECASNAHVFGPVNYTDHSNFDVIPALCVGLIFFALQLILRVRHVFIGPHAVRAWSSALDSRSVAYLLPCIFAFQMLSLYLMETAEQYIVVGHSLGGTIWLGGPVIASLAIHALFCLLTTCVIARVLRVFARTAQRIVRLIHTLATLPVHGPSPIFRRFQFFGTFRQTFPVVCRIGERAPPFAVA